MALKNNYKTVVKESVFKIVSIVAYSQSSAYVYDESSIQLEISYCQFIGSNDFLMAIFVKESASVIIESSFITGFKAYEFSALTAISNTKECNFSILNSSVSKNWSGKNGGGVYSENYRLIIENSEISFNGANYSGGGIYFITPECDSCGIYLIGNTKIFNNSCNSDGGAIKWEDYKPLIEDSVLIYNNTAAYGADFASSPATFGLLQSRRLSDTSITTLSNVPPSKKVTEIIQVSILDTYGQIVKTENSIVATLFVNETQDSLVAITGTTTFKAKNGLLNITDFILTGVPGSSAYL